ncbi:MAG: DUF2177 family protein, partial [Pseudomonadota bacterium]
DAGATGLCLAVAAGGACEGAVGAESYDMTNLATLRDWPVIIVIVDVAWGTFLTGTAAVAGYFITRALS